MRNRETNEDSGPHLPRLGRIHEIVEISEDDLNRASLIPPDGCPRRYCWWWRSLSFEWDLPPIEGCTWLQCDKPEHWHFTDVPCSRADPSSNIDHFEPREPHIERDNIDASRWMEARRLNRDAYFCTSESARRPGQGRRDEEVLLRLQQPVEGTRRPGQYRGDVHLDGRGVRRPGKRVRRRVGHRLLPRGRPGLDRRPGPPGPALDRRLGLPGVRAGRIPHRHR